MNNDSLLDFAPYLFLLSSDSTYYLNYWISVPEGFKAEKPSQHNDLDTQTKVITINVVESIGTAASIVKVEMESLTELEGLTQVKVLVEYPQEEKQNEKSAILLFSNADPTPVPASGSQEGILAYKPYGYWAKDEERGEYTFYYLFYSPENRDLHAPSEDPSEGDKYFLGYILDVPQSGEGIVYSGRTKVPSINMRGEPYTFLDAYVATLENGGKKLIRVRQPQTTGTVIFIFDDAD